MRELQMNPHDDAVASFGEASEYRMRGILLDTQAWAFVRYGRKEQFLPLASIPARDARRVRVAGLPVLTQPHGTHRLDDEVVPRSGLDWFPGDVEVRGLAAAAAVLAATDIQSGDVYEPDWRVLGAEAHGLPGKRHLRMVRGLRPETTVVMLAKSVEPWGPYRDKKLAATAAAAERTRHGAALRSEALDAAGRLDAWLEGRTDLRAGGASSDPQTGDAVRMPRRVHVSADLLHVIAQKVGQRRG